MGLACCVPHLACCVPHLACCVPHLAWRVPRCFQPRCRTRSLQRLTSSDFKHARSAERQNQPILIRTRQKTSVLHKTRDGPSEKQKAKSKKAKSKPQKAKAKSKQKSSEIGCHSTKRAEGQVPPPSFHVHLHRVHEKYVVQIPRCPPLGDRVDEEGRAVPRHRDDVQEPIQQHDFLQRQAPPTHLSHPSAGFQGPSRPTFKGRFNLLAEKNARAAQMEFSTVIPKKSGIAALRSAPLYPS